MDETLIELLEHERKKIMFPLWLCIGLGVLGFLSFFTFPLGPFLGMLLAMLLYFVWVNPKMQEYKRIYKEMVVTKPFRETFQKFMYDPKDGLSKEEIRNTGLIMLGNRYHSEDYMTGTYKDIRFERSDVLIQDHHSDSNGGSHTTTYFQGRWLVFQSPKQFHTSLQIIQKGFSYSNTKRGLFTKKEERRHEVEFESERFNSMFTCYCQNDQEAYYLITPHMQEAILKLSQLVDGKLMLGFTGNRLHLAIHNGKNTLEPSVFSKVSYQNDILAVKREISAITDVINILNLDCNLYNN